MQNTPELVKTILDQATPKKGSNYCTPKKDYRVLELFAGAGGLALGLEKAGLKCIGLNEMDKWACQTLLKNRPNWNVMQGDITSFDFSQYIGKVDVITGGFPCQAFSSSGKNLGLKDARGTLFYEFAKIVDQVNPLICVGENVTGLLSHNNGETLKGMISVLSEMGYKVVPIQVLNSVDYKVAQKRKRIFIVGVRKDIDVGYQYPIPYNKQYTVRDALKKGELYAKNVPKSEGFIYPQRKREILDLVPPKGYWKDLPVDIQKEYMGNSFRLKPGQTGIARRIGWDEASLTLTCSPMQKLTDRCHPAQTRPFTVREYARIQSFPDEWEFEGSIEQQYKQIGNAVPVNLGKEIGYSIISFLNQLDLK